MVAKPDDWKRLPFGEMVSIPYRATFNDAQYERIARGLIPQAMEDKWFVYLDGSDLCFHRSWTGQAIYRVTLAAADRCHAVAEALCATEMLEKNDANYQSELLGFLIHNLLLGEARPFPQPTGLAEQLSSVYQHAVSGTGYRGKTVARKPWWKFWTWRA